MKFVKGIVLALCIVLSGCDAEQEYGSPYPCNFIFYTSYHTQSTLTRTLSNPGQFVIVEQQMDEGVVTLLITDQTGETEKLRLTTEKERRLSYGSMGANRRLVIGCSNFNGIKAYDGKYDYASLHEYLDNCEKIMMQRGNRATLHADRKRSEWAEQIGHEGMQSLKRHHYNLQLETQLAGYDAKELCKVVDGHIVPTAGFVYLTPRSTNGGAPFYSSTKRIGPLSVPTLHFNICVMLLMSIITIICLSPKPSLRKKLFPKRKNN